jgi:hypothetical protein
MCQPWVCYVGISRLDLAASQRIIFRNKQDPRVHPDISPELEAIASVTAGIDDNWVLREVVLVKHSPKRVRTREHSFVESSLGVAKTVLYRRCAKACGVSEWGLVHVGRRACPA